MPCIIDIPNRTHEDFGDSLAKLIAVVNGIIACADNEIILNFNNAKMLNPFFLGGLVCVINRLRNEGKTLSLNHDTNPSISSYLGTICFPETFSPLDDKESDYLKKLEKYSAKTYIPIISFKTGTSEAITLIRENILSAVSQLMKNQLKFTEKERMPLTYFLAELTDNINEHSTASEGYVFAQYYPNSNYLDLCICDAGHGIFQSYLDNQNFDPKSEEEAIQLALSGRSTKNRPEARGFGITTTRNMLVNGLRGKLFLWSGNTTFLQTVNKEAIVNLDGNGSFQGTFIALRLPTIIPGSFDFYKFIER
jgi:hypothetical protein